MYALILAGGTGTRLWPRSRATSPKQLLPLGYNDVTMMQATVRRILPIVPIEQIFVATNREYGPLIREQLPDLPAANVVEEPSGKNTAPCIGLAAVHMQAPDQVMASLHSDHYIADEEGFRQALLAAEEVAKQGYLVTLGIKPNRPETGYGYLQRGRQIGVYNHYPVYEAARFLEKPSLERAEQFVRTGEYYWNSGIFIWQISTLRQAFEEHMPQFGQQLGQLEKALANGEKIDTIWANIQARSIDVGIMEQAEKVAVVPVDIGWNDVGSWEAIYEINRPDEAGNVVLNTEHVAVDTTGCLLQSVERRLIATIGLEDVIVVDSGDAILVCARERAQEVKKIVNWLEEHGPDGLL